MAQERSEPAAHEESVRPPLPEDVPIVAFDFDGTLTVRDSFTAFLKWRASRARYAVGLLRLAPAAISYFDGFFYFPTQVLARATPVAGKGRTTPFKEGQELKAYTAFVDVSKVEPDVRREW